VACEWREIKDKIPESLKYVAVHATGVKRMTAYIPPRGSNLPPSIPEVPVQ